MPRYEHVLTDSRGESSYYFTSIGLYLHFHCESLNEPLYLRYGSYLHEQIDLSHTHTRAI